MVRLTHLQAAIAAGLLYAALCVFLYFTEGLFWNTIFIMAMSGAIIAALTFLSRRPLFSVWVYASFVAAISIIAEVKFENQTFTLHAWDFIHYARSWASVAEWWSGRPEAVAMLAGALASLLLGGWIAWRADRPFGVRPWAAAACVALSIGAYAAVRERGERMHMQFNFPDWHLTSFLVSWVETAQTLWRGGLIDAAATSEAPPFQQNWTCAPPVAKRPHVIMIHQESVGPPFFFPEVTYDPGFVPLFNSFDGKLHKMNVETFAGASWITESAILMGLSSKFFGGMKDFIQFYMADRVKDAMPQVLEKCGYRNVMFYPYNFGVFGNRKFFESIGIREVFDKKAMGAQYDWDRDRFYYDHMLNEIERHLKTSDKPLFSFVLTMSAHWPYTWTFAPEMNVPTGGPNNHPEMNEYLRRLAMVKMDLDYLKEELGRRFPGEQFLLVQYGDHHALPASYLWGYTYETGVQDMTLPEGFPLYTTYFSVDGVNYTPPRLPALDSVDTAFVPAIFLDAARLPLPESWRERLRLMQLCEGLAWQCKQRDEILKFHRRLIDSKLIQTN